VLIARKALLGGGAAVLCALSFGWVALTLVSSAAPQATPKSTIYRSAPVLPAPTATPAADLVVAASAPLRLRAASIGLDGAVSEYTQEMIDERGGFDPSELTTISWDTTITDGLAGTDAANTVYLYGHTWVDAAVFNGLKDLQPGAVAGIDTANGTLCYVTQKTLTLNKTEYKNNDELTNAIPNRLVLVSCYRPVGYDPDAATVKNIVVVLQLDQEQTNVGC
jgi:hypothetical protein